MRKIVYLFFAFIILSCNSVSKIFNSGKLASTNYEEYISFNYDNNFALIDVEINGKPYTFLVDTGAPTCISNEIYEDLNIKPIKTISISDSQGQNNYQELVVVPEIRIGNLSYENIGAVVVDLRNVFEFNCMGIDGIIGANQMAKSYWKFDYENHKITITDQLEKLDIASYTDSMRFFYTSQKTPYIVGRANGIKTTFTYDTGSSGNIDIKKTIGKFKNSKSYSSYGNSNIGLYDTKDSVSIRTVKIDSLYFNDLFVGAQTVDLDHGSLIGNDFMNKHDIVMDWKTQNIYLKKLKDYETTKSTSFGFGYRLKDNQTVVSRLIKELDTDLKLGDQILKINNQDLSKVDESNACNIYNDFTLKGLDRIELTYMRNGKEKTITLDRVILIE